MALNRKKLEAFIKRNLLRGAESGDNPIVRMTMRHAMGGNKAAVVLDMEVDPNQSALDLTSRFEEAANDDAEGIGGLQGYVITTYFQATPDKATERFSFRIAVESEEDDALSQTEAPTTQGLTSQLMRHNEAQARVMTMGMAEVVRQQNRMIERLAEQNDKLMGRHFDVLELTEKVMEERANKDIEKMKVTSEIARTDEAVGKLLQLAPVVANKFMGKKMLPEKATAGEIMVQTFVESLRPEQMKDILEKLDPAQQVIVMELIQAQQAREEAEKKDKK